ncbi:hypothetical protein HYH03_017976 [Edaphochlamys debaryana]|uniref:Fucosyltransferase n=1 Tax=Edaphochlamys debaryana TaxID=47281 RepID=A0A836BNL0_9CHLO|nr:hypothetical protein HYH03_017976 [Edaphochlamys debaryana]|eukprot:KAG2483130.1 hypothetical protein HYH03_017976 [Edaphochlamys debaryana]
MALWAYGLLLASLLLGAAAQDPLSRATNLADHRAALQSGVCSKLYHHYTELHANVLSGKAPQKFLVHVSPSFGLADRLTGLVAAFYYALLTQRALLIAPHPLPYELIYDQPSFNWTTALPHDSVLSPVRWPVVNRMCSSCGPQVPAPEVDPRMNCAVCLDDGKAVAYMNWVTVNTVRQWHMTHNISDTYDGVHTLYYSSNYGVSVSLFHNAMHQRQLYALGLRPSTAFGCALNMMFFPKPETFAVVLEEMNQLLLEPLVIGVQIRTNDDHMGGRDLPDDAINGYKIMLDCAASFEQHLGRGPLNAKFFVVSDSAIVRQRAMEQWYPGKVIVYLRTKPVHINNSGKDDLHGSRLAAAEHWLFGMTDFQIVHWWSGYGRTAAMRGMREMSIHAWAEVPTECKQDNQQSVWQVGEGNSGVRRMLAEL